MTTLRAGTVSTIALSGLVVVFGVGHTVAPGWAKRLGLDIWNLPSLRAAVTQVERESEEVDAKGERLLQSIEAADHIVARLVDGKLTLSQATDELEPLLRNRPGFDTVCTFYYKVKTLREGTARYAIEHASITLEHDPTRKARVLQRLQAEFTTMK
jgi:hypothetical protein